MTTSSNSPSSETMFLVMYSTGEYSDRGEYPCCVTRDESKAQQLVNDLSEIFDVVEASYGFGSQWQKYEAAVKDAEAKVSAMFPGDSVRVDESSRAWLAQVPVIS